MNIKRILLAEDDDDDFNLLNSAILSISKSIDILRTKNGMMLLSIIETSIKPDLIILDINMPYKNGLSCLKELRSKKYYDPVKVIIYSTSANKAEINRCYDMGADFYMIKPSEYNSIIFQFKELFSSDYFLKNKKTSPEHFLRRETLA